MKAICIYGIHQILVLLILGAMAYQDIRSRTLSKKARLWFLPVVLFTAYPAFLLSGSWGTVLVQSLSGAAVGLSLPLAANLALRKKNHGHPLFGGADLWILCDLGWIYGTVGVLAILLVSTIFSGAAGTVIRWRTKKRFVTVPYLPFVFLGTCIILSVGLWDSMQTISNEWR